MKITASISVALCVLAVMAGAYGVSAARESADMLVVQASSGSIAPARMFARWMLKRLDHCPVEDFHPTTPIGFVIAGWEQMGARERFAPLLDLLLARGCSIDSYGGSGLTPLHSAILFNNADAVHTLLSLGADRNLPTTIQSSDEAREINLNALGFAHYLDSLGGEDRAAIITALE